MAQEIDVHTIRSQSQFPLDATAYQLVSEIGNGLSATVYKALCLPLNSTVVAIKSIDFEQSRLDFDNIRREAKTMSLLSHPNILKAHCSFTVDHRLWVVMPFMSAGSLQSINSSSFPNGLPESVISIVLREILRALAYLHDQGHLHRDIKAGNILIDANGSVKLSDFGVSASIYEPSCLFGAAPMSSSSLLTDFTGTPYWMAPEVIHSHSGYSFKADIWSFGITSLELAHGRPPLSDLPPSKSLLMKITRRFRFSDYEKGSNEIKNKKFSKAFKDMVSLCLRQDPSKRPTAEKLLKHPFFKNCKSVDFLIKNLLVGLPSVEERFKMLKLSRVPSISKTSEGCEENDVDFFPEKQRRISGWNFNEDGFQLDPVFPRDYKEVGGGKDKDPVRKRVQFGAQVLGIPDKGDGSSSSNLSPSFQTRTVRVDTGCLVSSPRQAEEICRDIVPVEEAVGGTSEKTVLVVEQGRQLVTSERTGGSDASSNSSSPVEIGMVCQNRGYEVSPSSQAAEMSRKVPVEEAGGVVVFEGGQSVIHEIRGESDAYSNLRSPVLKGNVSGARGCETSSPGSREVWTQEKDGRSKEVDVVVPEVAGDKDMRIESRNSVDVGIDREGFVTGLMKLRESLDDQRNGVSQLIAFLSDEQEVADGSGEVKSKKELTQMVEKLKIELEREKKKNNELQMELEFLKKLVSGVCLCD